VTTKSTILKEIRRHCLECCCGSTKEVELCRVNCQMKPFRSGLDPNPSRMNNIPKSPLAQDEFFKNSVHEGIDTLGAV